MGFKVSAVKIEWFYRKNAFVDTNHVGRANSISSSMASFSIA